MQNSITDFFSSIGRLPHFLDLANDYFDYINLPEENMGGIPYQGIKTEITVRNANFTYPGSQEKTLKNINLTIRAGEKVVILGVNGSGKTTLTKLLTGIYPAASGQICYDGVPVGEINRVQFFQKLSIISQDFIVYNLSLKENIALADIEQSGDTERIERSLENVGLRELLADRDNLNKIIGREFSGLELSTGQRQRIAIARAVFKDSDCIILDEPTSALDPLLEAEILKGFIRLSENKTALIISHRTGLCTMVDNIAVMKEGELVEYGTHDMLLRQNGEYARLYEMQKKWYV
jgi:ABC-type multidrug transport system fused ATPase/permease subunit